MGSLSCGQVAAAIRDALERPDALEWEPQASELAILAHHLGHRTDDEAIAALRRIAELAPRAVVIERARPDALGPYAADEHAIALARTGSALRDDAEIARLTGLAGWRRERSVELGWGVEATFSARR